MTSIKLYCNGAMARAQVDGHITHGMVGVPIQVEWDAAWEGLYKTIKVRCGDVSRTVLVDDDRHAIIPYECLIAGRFLEIGMDGWDADGTLRIPSCWASCGRVMPSVAKLDGPDAAPPTVDTVAQLQILVSKAESAAGELAGAADAAAISASDADTAKNEAVQAKTDAEAAKESAIEAQTGAVNAKKESEFAKGVAESAANDAKSAKETAETAKTEAILAKEAAEASKNEAFDAKQSAETARDDAISAKNEAVSAKDEVHSDRVAAENAKTSAETAKTSAEAAQKATESAKSGAVTAKEAAENAQRLAEEAKSGADSAKIAAEEARDGAVTAKDSAETAKTAALGAQSAAETAKSGAETAQTNAETAESHAKTYAEQAATAKSSAETAAQSAGQSATDADSFAKKAQGLVDSLHTDFTAMQSDVNQIKNDLSKIETEHFPFNYGYAETQNGYYSKFSSKFTPDLSYVSKKMEVTDGDICCITCSTPKALGFAMCYFWDENMNVLSYLNENADASGNQYTNEIVEVPKNARYIVTTGRVVYECKLAKLSYEPTSLPLKGKNIVNLGDSIFGNNNTLTGVSSLLAKETYANVINCAFGGTKMVVRDKINGYDKFDFENLVDAIVSGDFIYQNNAIASYNLPDYYAGRLQILRNIDFSKVDIVTLNYSTNDYTWGVPKATLKQAYIDTVSALQNAYPNLVVVIISPTWRCWLNDDGSFKEDSNTKIWWSQGDSTLVDYCNTLQEIAKELNVQYIDVYNIGINKNTWTHYFTSDDTTHQNENGRKRIVDVIASNLY